MYILSEKQKPQTQQPLKVWPELLRTSPLQRL